jgi:hypothetical protein
MMCITITCLVRAIDDQATVRLCVTKGDDPWLPRGRDPEVERATPPREEPAFTGSSLHQLNTNAPNQIQGG